MKILNASQVVFNSINRSSLPNESLNYFLSTRFQHTIVTCRTTVYVLFSFWLFFFFFGESLLLILFNFSTVSDTIPSNYFFSLKTFNSFTLRTASTNLTNVINFFIIFFTSCSLIFLINLKLVFNYSYFKNVFAYDLLLAILVFFLFFQFFFAVVIATFLIGFKILNHK